MCILNLSAIAMELQSLCLIKGHIALIWHLNEGQVVLSLECATFNFFWLFTVHLQQTYEITHDYEVDCEVIPRFCSLQWTSDNALL